MLARLNLLETVLILLTPLSKDYLSISFELKDTKSSGAFLWVIGPMLFDRGDMFRLLIDPCFISLCILICSV